MIKVRDTMTWTYVMNEAGLPEGVMGPLTQDTGADSTPVSPGDAFR